MCDFVLLGVFTHISSIFHEAGWSASQKTSPMGFLYGEERAKKAIKVLYRNEMCLPAA